MLVGFLYNAGPLPISRTPLGEVFAGGFLGWVLVSLTIFVVRGGSLSPEDLLVGVPSMLLVASILTVNNTCDIHGDALSGRRTLSVLIGRLWGERLVYFMGALAYLSSIGLVLLDVLPLPVMAGLLAAGLASLPLYTSLHRRGLNHETKGVSMGAISKVLIRFTAGFVTPVVILSFV
jgi:1,4-dihydroxy-2-naphthoate octaprenyltransferase